jgi:hypothetical protein
MQRAAAELFLASLFTETTPERLEALRNAAEAAKSWEGLLGALEGHGVLALFLRNVAAAGIELPASIAPSFQARATVQRDDHQRARLSLQRFLAAAARAGVEVTAVGGSALALELHPDGLRRAGEIELLVAPEHLTRALRAADEAGLLLDESALPAWWVRRAHASLALAPSSAMLRGMRLRTTLHHPSLLLLVREPEIVGRRRQIAFEGHPLRLLDPLDALLELAVRIAVSAGEERLTGGRRHLLAAAGSSVDPLRLEHVLDLRTFVERRHAELPLAAVVARAQEWNAEPALRAVLECLLMGLGFLPEAREWARELARRLAAASTPGACALFRPDPIERLPLWLRPSEAFLARRYALPLAPATSALRRARARHVALVLGSAALAGAAFPVALLARRLSRDARRRRWQSAQAPQRLSDVTEAWRAAARVEQQQPIAPRAVRLLPQEEGALRFPDHYKG